MVKIKSSTSNTRPKKTSSSSGKVSNGRRHASDISKWLSSATPTQFLIFFAFLSMFLTVSLLEIFPVIRFSD